MLKRKTGEDLPVEPHFRSTPMMPTACAITTVNVSHTFAKTMDATSYLNSADTAPARSISQYDRPYACGQRHL